jgi:uncharacterized protein (TIGR03435 family)
MMKVLLEDRFKLKIHRETKEIPVYALTVAKGGPKLPVAREGGCVPVDRDHPFSPPAAGQPLPPVCGRVRMTDAGFDTYGQTMAGLCLQFSTRLDLEVVDKTGITGMFDIHLDLPRAYYLAGFDAGQTPPELSDSAARAAPPDPGDIFALVQTAVQKVGLRLEQTRDSDEFLVIDHVERPSGN